MVYFIVFFISVDLNQSEKSYSRSPNRVLIANDGHLLIENNPKEIVLAELVVPTAEQGHRDCSEPKEHLATTFADRT